MHPLRYPPVIPILGGGGGGGGVTKTLGPRVPSLHLTD